MQTALNIQELSYDQSTSHSYFLRTLKNPSNYSKTELATIASRALSILEHKDRENMISFAQSLGDAQSNKSSYQGYLGLLASSHERMPTIWMLGGLTAVISTFLCVWCG
jgi:hypothetical protein